MTNKLVKDVLLSCFVSGGRRVSPLEGGEKTDGTEARTPVEYLLEQGSYSGEDKARRNGEGRFFTGEALCRFPRYTWHLGW